MRYNVIWILPYLAILSFSFVLTGFAQDDSHDEKSIKGDAMLNDKTFLQSLVGSWQGTCRTWFQPGKLADESEVEGEFRLILDGRFLRHTYRGMIQGNTRSGEETIAYYSAAKTFQICWFDDFHMNDGIMFSQGDATETGFAVLGKYVVGPDQPDWGWKTVYDLSDENHLTITAYNVTADGQEAKAVETKYTRIKPE